MKPLSLRPLFSLILLCALLCPSYARAAAVVAQQQQAQQQMQQEVAQEYQRRMQEQAVAQYQQAMAQQAAAQYQAAQVQAIRQQIIQQAVQAQIQAQVVKYVQQKQIQEVQQALLEKAVEEELVKIMTAQVQQGMAAQQIQAEMIQQAIAAATVRLAQIGYLKAAKDQIETAQAMQMVAAASRAGAPAQEEVKEIVDIGQVWAKFEVNSKAWLLLMEPQAKATTVNEFIERYRKEGIKIQKPPGYYAQMIDDMAAQNPQMLLNPFKQVLQILAIMEYDFDNGTDRDALARKLLGDGYDANKQRLGK